MKPAICNSRYAAKGMLLLQFILLVLTMNGLAQQTTASNVSALRLNEANIYAERHFHSHFLPTTEVKWYRTACNYVALCNEGDSVVKVYYKLNGNFESCIKYYPGNDLEADLKARLISKFPGCQIMVVTELTNLEKEELFIKIKDGDYIRSIHYSEEGLVVTENILDGSPDPGKDLVQVNP